MSSTSTPTGEDTVDDSQTLSESIMNARSSLHETMKARKEAQRDVQLLLNRINLLKNEEAKALRSVAVSRTKANLLSDVKLLSQSRENEHKELRRLREAQASVNHERNKYLREVARVSREKSRTQLEKSRSVLAFESRKALRAQIEERLSVEKAERDEIQRRTEAIKQQRIASRQRIETERIERLRSLHNEFEKKMNEEKLRKHDSEELIQKLEKEEMELIKRLQKAQKLQTQVYDDSALGRVSKISNPVTPGAASVTSVSSSRVTPLSGRQRGGIPGPCVALKRGDLGGAALR